MQSKSSVVSISILSHKAVSTLRVSHGVILTAVHDEEVYTPGSCTQE